jgi:hypothetical protein
LSSDRPFLDKFTELEKKLKDAANAFEELKQDTFLKDKESKNIHEQYDEIVQKLKQKEESFTELEKKYNEILTKFREIKQNELIASDIIKDSEKQVTEIHSEKENLKSELNRIQSESKEKDMEQILLEEMVDMEQKEKHIATKKYYKTVIVAAVSIAIIAGVYSYMFAELAGQQYRVEDLGEMNSAYVIQNLKGDTIDTWLSWRLVDGYVINVNLIDGQKYPDKADIVRDVILSEEAIEIDNSLLHKGPKGTTSTYYVGWAGALASAKPTSEFYIPQKFNVIESLGGEGDITIKLTSQSSGDGFSGFTKSIADDAQNQILKSEITIYDMDKLSKAQFETILRHEFGHALGLAHSTAPEDLMHPTIETNYPYISECDIDAITLLYDGGKSSHVECQK